MSGKWLVLWVPKRVSEFHTKFKNFKKFLGVPDPNSVAPITVLPNPLKRGAHLPRADVQISSYLHQVTIITM